MSHTLILNAGYEPLGAVPLRRAVLLVVAEKAVVVTADPSTPVRSEALTLPSPTVIRLTRWVRIPVRHQAAFSRSAVLRRDHHVCQYCGDRATTVDHVVPRSRIGGARANTWTNVVAACAPCNHTKADRTPQECGWTLRRPPVAPAPVTAILIGLARTDTEAWTPFLVPFLPAVP